MPKTINMKKQREQFIKELVAAIRSLPPDASIDWQAQAGINKKPNEHGWIEASHNGSMTITIRVNGGAENHELQPDWMAPGYLDRH